MALKIDTQGKKALSIVGAIVIIAGLMFLIVSCAYLNQEAGLPNDNPIEQSVEAVIDAAMLYETGVNPEIDLTPEVAPPAHE